MKTCIYLSILFLTLSACKKTETKSDDREAHRLFSESVDLISFMINEINNAGDSICIDSLFKVFEKRITDINFSVPPQTDFFLSAEENDSIYELLSRLRETKEKRLQELAIVEPDTID